MLEGEGNDLGHAPLAGWMWWAVNPNSVDTGGLVHLSTHTETHLCRSVRLIHKIAYEVLDIDWILCSGY